jgi:hypothetical protein
MNAPGMVRKQGGGDGLVSPVARYCAIAYRGFDKSRRIVVVGAGLLRASPKLPADRQACDLL